MGRRRILISIRNRSKTLSSTDRGQKKNTQKTKNKKRERSDVSPAKRKNHPAGKKRAPKVYLKTQKT